MPMQFTPPPRRVPLSLVLTNLFGPFAQVGWLVFGFGMVFVWAFVANADYSFVTFRGDVMRAVGRVTRTRETDSSENRQRIVANYYQYSVAGRTFEGISYSKGQSVSTGEQVNVEYKPDAPERSRIQGMRVAPFSAVVTLVLLFPLIGLAFIIGSTKGGLKRNRLLRDGVLTTGVLKGTEPTNVTVNNRRVYAMTFEFTTLDGRVAQTVANTSFTERLEDEAREPLLYDRDDPSRAYLLDEAPSRPQLDGTGELRGRPIAALLAVILPLLVIAGHGLVLLIKLGVVR